MAITTALHQIYNKREVSLVTYISQLLAQSGLIQEFHLPLYIFIHEVRP